MTTTAQTSVLTGANKGLGLEAARWLGERGLMIFLGSRDERRGRAAANKLIPDGSNVGMQTQRPTRSTERSPDGGSPPPT